MNLTGKMSSRVWALTSVLLFFAVALISIIPLFAAHTETTTISPANTTFVKNNTPQVFNFNITVNPGSADNITKINITLPSSFVLNSFGNLSGAGFACSNVSAIRINCTNSSANGLNPAAPSVIIWVNATPQVSTGSHNWIVNTTDTAGAVNGSVVVTQVDAEAPTVAAPTVNVSSPTKLNTNFFINTSYSDDSGSGVVACSYNVTNSTGGLVVSLQMVSSGGQTGVANATISSSLPDGANSIYVNCTDNVSYTGFSAATVLTVDTKAPICSALISNDSFVKNGDSVKRL